MITVRYGSPDGLIKEKQSIFVSFPYSASIVQVMRSFYVRRWHPEKKYWELPYYSLPELQRLLSDEKFEVSGNPIEEKKQLDEDLSIDASLPVCRTTPYEYQKEVFTKALKFNKYILNLEMGTGKAQPLYSKILTPNGFITMGEVQVGMSVLGEDGLPHKVLGVFPQGKRSVYELVFSDGSKCRCSDEHLWTFWRRNNPKRAITKTLKEFLVTPLYYFCYHKGKQYKYFLPKVSPSCFSLTTLVDNQDMISMSDRSLRAVSYVGEEECQCIYIDSPTHLYITDDFIPTHNTLVSSLIMKKRMEQNKVKRCLIVPCVASLKYNWQEELRTHLGENSLVLGNRRNKKGRWVVKGTQEKLADLDKLKVSDKWIITNVESFRNADIKKKIKKLVQKGEIDALIVDEVHKLVSPQAQQTKAILSIASGINYTLLLTGTILLNRPTDLFVPLKLIDAEPKTFTAFKNFYCIMGGYGNYQIVGYKNLDELQYRLSEVSARVRKDDVLDLPDKVFVDEYLEMSNKQAGIYQQVLDAIMTDIDKVMLTPNPLAEMIRLRQATADTSILSESVTESVKFERAEQLIDDIVDGGNSVLVFSNWATVITNFAKRLSVKYKTAKITGQTLDVMAQKDKFNESDCNVLLMTTKAGGTGHTFNKASYIIFLDEPWTNADLQQAVARCHRIGQTKSVTIYTLMCKDTIDEYIHRIIKRKAALGDSLVDAKYNLKNKEVINFLLTGEGTLE